MQTINLELFDAEVKDIINVLGQLPTSSNAWPLAQKITVQLNNQLPPTVEEQTEITNA